MFVITEKIYKPEAEFCCNGEVYKKYIILNNCEMSMYVCLNHRIYFVFTHDNVIKKISQDETLPFSELNFN